MFALSLGDCCTSASDKNGTADEPRTRTKYWYDDLNRLVGITYPTVPSGVGPMPNVCKVNAAPSNNANVCYVYGTTPASYNNGRVISMTDPSGSESYTYDQFGNVTQLAKVIGANTYTTKYSYNLANELTQIKYPSGRIVQQSFDAIGRLCEIAPSTTSCGTAASPFATGYGYNTAGQLTGFKYGNGITASFSFSPDRLQLASLTYQNSGGVSMFLLNYGYTQNGGNNGQITSVANPNQPGQSVNYTYDALDRLSTALSVGSSSYPQWGLSWTYDRYGNRLTQSVTAGTGVPSNSVSVNPTTNRINTSGYSYDNGGNMTNDGLNTLVYDAENRLLSATNGTASGNYSYDSSSLRVTKVSGSTTTVYVFSGRKVIAEYDNGAAPTAPTREYIYSGGKYIAKIESGATTYIHTDHLSQRFSTDSNQNYVTHLGQYPFGEIWYNDMAATKNQFTTYEHDAESGNHYAKARYYISRLGRFNSPDPMSGNPTNPQSWNRYSYVLNDPINLNDPEGEYCQYMDDSGEVVEEVDYDSNTSECAQNGGYWVPDDSDPGQQQDQCDANCQLQQAEQLALTALTQPDCAKAVDGGTGSATNTLLENLSAANPTTNPADIQYLGFGTITTTSDLKPTTGGVTTNNATINSINAQGVPVHVGFTSTIAMNSDPLGLFMNPGGFGNYYTTPYGKGTGYPSEIFQAIELLHELGHGSLLSGTPSSIVPDEGSAGASLKNTQTIEDNCFPVGDFTVPTNPFG